LVSHRVAIIGQAAVTPNSKRNSKRKSKKVKEQVKEVKEDIQV